MSTGVVSLGVHSSRISAAHPHVEESLEVHGFVAQYAEGLDIDGSDACANSYPVQMVPRLPALHS